MCTHTFIIHVKYIVSFWIIFTSIVSYHFATCLFQCKMCLGNLSYLYTSIYHSFQVLCSVCPLLWFHHNVFFYFYSDGPGGHCHFRFIVSHAALNIPARGPRVHAQESLGCFSWVTGYIFTFKWCCQAVSKELSLSSEPREGMLTMAQGSQKGSEGGGCTSCFWKTSEIHFHATSSQNPFTVRTTAMAPFSQSKGSLLPFWANS